MPLLFSLKQHRALQAVQAQLLPGEKLFAYLDDVYVTTPTGVGAIYRLFERELWIHANIGVHGGKTRVWNSGGHRPAACDELERISPAVNGGNVCRGSQVPQPNRGSKFWGLRWATQTSWMRIWRGPLANIWCSLRRSCLSLICSLHGCSSPTALQPRPLTSCACSHRPWFAGLLKIMMMVCGIVSVNCWMSSPNQRDIVRASATTPLILDGLGLKSAVRKSESAYWANWANCVPKMQEKHPEVAREFCDEIGGWSRNPHARALPRQLPAIWHPRV